MTRSLEAQLEALSTERDGVLGQVEAKEAEWVTVLERFADEGIAHIASTTGWDAMTAANRLFKECADVLENDHLSKAHATGDIDWSEVLRTQDLFTRYGNEIGSALLLAALPQTYATERGAKVLVASSGLETDLTRRVRGTAQFLMLVMLATKAPEGPESYESCNSYLQNDAERVWCCQRLDTSGVRWRVCATLRVHHEAIRRVQESRAGSVDALNQEDLLGALLTFTITVFEVLEQFGISWTDADQLAYLRTWNLIGESLGITGLGHDIAGSPYSAPFQQDLPQTVGEARRILDALRARNWKPLDTYGGNLMKELTQTDPGVRLIAALLAELSSELPGPLKRLPEVVIRQLAAPVVRDRLGLGDGGLMQAGADYLPGALGAVNFVPGARLAARARASWLRQAANTVCRATTVHFVCSEPGLPEFIIPGLVEWSDSLRTQTGSRQPRSTTPRQPGDARVERAVSRFKIEHGLKQSLR